MCKRSILVVDDEKAICDMLAMKLSCEGFEVFEAMGGDEAIHKAEEKHPDLILLDILMPHVNGLDVCRYLKKNIHTSDIPVIMVSCIHDLDTRLESFQIGAADFVTKPFINGSLIKSVLKVLHPSILIVDDNEDLRIALKIWFEDQGYRISIAGSASQAYSLMEEHVFQLALLDYNLGSGPTGVDIFNYIKNKGFSTKTLFITSEFDAEDLNMLITEKQCELVQKPFRLKLIDEKVKRLLK
ncbi:MAG: response regulator [Candidatus Eremiobacterota bacterium]